MKPSIKIHQTSIATHLPAHEIAAAKRRAAALHLPGVPGHRPPRKLASPIHRGRKTVDTHSNYQYA
jgi:hypothetical protein